jgi:PAS domain S-box-containing protein
VLHLRAERLVVFWFRLTEPFDSVKGETQRRQSRLLASICLFLAGALVLLFVPTCLKALETATILEIGAVSINLVLMLFFYLLSRSVHNRFVIPSLIALGSTIILLPVLLTQGNWGINNLHYLLATIIFSGLFLRMRVAFGIFVAQNAMVVLLGLMLPRGLSAVMAPLQFNLLMGMLSLIIVYYIHKVEGERRTQLAASERRYRNLVENVRDVVYEHSPDGTLLSINSVIEAVSGWRTDEMIGQPIQKFIHPDDWSRLSTIALLRKKPAIAEVRLCTKSGEYRTVEFKATPEREDGRIVRIFGIGRDVSERKQAEMALRDSQRFIQQIADTAPFMIHVFDLVENRSIYTNRYASEFFAWPAPEKSSDWERLIHPDDLPKLAEHRRRWSQVQDGEVVTYEYRTRTPEGNWRCLRGHEVIFKRNEMGAPTQVLGVTQDITEQRQAENNKLSLMIERERFNLFNRFALALSHDFRTSLATIETSRYLIERQTSPEIRSVIQPKLDNIHLFVSRMGEQLKNLNTIYGLSALQIEPFELRPLFDELIVEQQATAKDRDVVIGLHDDDTLPSIPADREKVKQALKHLLVNALMHTPPGGQVSISTRLDGNCITIQIHDNGLGITERDLPHIFDLFYRADPARALESGGVGVGLSIVKMIAEAHGGSVTAHSQPGAGSVFTLSLPISA